MSEPERRHRAHWGGGFDASATRIAGSDLSPRAFAGILRTLASQLENEDRTKESAP